MSHRLTSRTGLAVLAVVPVLGLAACGSDKKDSNRSGGYGSALSKDDFVKQANALCKTGQAEATKIQADFSNPPTDANLQKIEDFLDKYIPKSKALVPPDGDLKTAWDTFGTANKAQLADVKAAIGATGSARNSALSRLASDGQSSDDAVKSAGLTDCAN